MFTDRTDAGEQLAESLADRGVDPDIVLTIPRGGLPVGRAVADRFAVPLDVVVASKMGAPDNEELAIGAVAEDGSVWRNDELIAELGVTDDYLDRVRERERAVAEEKAATYREGEFPDVTDERVLVVDDGVATGATMRACLQRVRDDDPEYLIAAVPVGPADTLDTLLDIADDVASVETPPAFRAVGAYYEDFPQVTDEEAQTYLDGDGEEGGDEDNEADDGDESE
ncbi:phosphoribosyltransferase [Halomicrobium urmianum]|uniref:phosphoribosyltransferase n=1 Tax=Halomicrobium urmianum TaxID=1586233 RepID=UPI001CD95697|nr:phosphoribosyltransferase family protein [Halomicrobium urmianum]